MKNHSTLIKWLSIAVCCLAVLCIALVVTLIIVVSRGHHANVKVVQDCSPRKDEPRVNSQKTFGVFDDLTPEEIIKVRDFIIAQNALNVTPFDKATLASNYIYLIELQQPTKEAALEFLDNGGPKPVRRAKVIVHRGGDAIPTVQQYIVEPVERPTKYSKLGNPIPFHKSIFDDIQLGIVEKVLLQLTEELYPVLYESYDGYTYHNCTDKCLSWCNSQPAALQTGQHKVWIWFVREMPGMYIHPVGLEVLLDCPGIDQKLWKVEKIYYNNKTFNDGKSLINAYYKGLVQKIFLKALTEEQAIYSTYKQRGDPLPRNPQRGPQLYEPDGKRYTVQGHHVQYMGWSFDFRARSSTGLQMFNIMFEGRRIVYELSLQEAGAFYSAHSPMQMFTDYLDSGWGMGSSTFELVPGVDCPESATLIDVIHYVNTPRPRRMKNAVCIFEFNTGIPLRRHFENDLKGGYAFYGGMPTYALFVRSISTPYNYDYVFDYVFYNNGVVEVRVATSGYIQATLWTSNELPYGNEVHKHVAGTIHDHLFNFKVDLDVIGRKNSYETIDIDRETIVNPWFPVLNRTQKVIHRRTKTTEKNALYHYNFDRPKYLNFYSETNLTKTGQHRGYRIDLRDVIKQIYPESLPFMNSAKWALHQMVVTKYKESEMCSSSMFNQMDPYKPEVDFQTFYTDDENIRNEDLVAWVTVGVMHVPHTEDIPNTATVGNAASFFLRPFNYFDEDPSMRSRDAILITPKDNKFSSVKVEKFGTPDGPKCTPVEKPLEFTGRYGFA